MVSKKKYTVAIITYDVAHLKSIKILNTLIVKGYKLTSFVIPFKKKKKKTKHFVFSDRPNPILRNFDFKDYCEKNKINIVKFNSWEKEKSEDILKKFCKLNSNIIFINCISKIIPEWFLKHAIVLNAHPGILPHARGLDSFKWSVIKKIRLGVTLHIIDKNIDCGTILKKSYLPIYQNDTLIDVANRSFELECILLSNFEFFINNKSKKKKISKNSKYFLKRISGTQEKRMEKFFLEYKKKYKIYKKK